MNEQPYNLNQGNVLHVEGDQIRLNDDHDIVKKFTPRQRKKLLDNYKKLAANINTLDTESLNELFWNNFCKNYSKMIVETMNKAFAAAQLDITIFDSDDQGSLISSLLTVILDTQKYNDKIVMKKVQDALVEWLQNWCAEPDLEDLTMLVNMAEDLRSCEVPAVIEESVEWTKEGF